MLKRRIYYYFLYYLLVQQHFGLAHVLEQFDGEVGAGADAAVAAGDLAGFGDLAYGFVSELYR